MRYLFAFILLASLPFLAHGGNSPEDLVAKAKSVLAQLEGDIAIPGVKEPVEVLRDRWGCLGGGQPGPSQLAGLGSDCRHFRRGVDLCGVRSGMPRRYPPARPVSA